MARAVSNAHQRYSVYSQRACGTSIQQFVKGAFVGSGTCRQDNATSVPQNCWKESLRVVLSRHAGLKCCSKRFQRQFMSVITFSVTCYRNRGLPSTEVGETAAAVLTVYPPRL